MNWKTTLLLCHAIVVLLLILTGCADGDKELKKASGDGDSTAEEQARDRSTKIDDTEKPEADSSSPSTNDSGEISVASDENDSNEAITNPQSDTHSNNTYENNNLLAEYSDEEIEYARIWLQLGPNQQIDELNVTHIPAGTPLEPEYFPVADYPEDVTQLSGSRIADGSVTYSSNGDGTINVYNVPLLGRWYGGTPPGENLGEAAMRETFEEIISNTEEVYVDPGDVEAVKRLIELINQ
ncbi:hypothetical protein SAMN05421503_1546 [Terribacillus aidingensis]|uniref:Lipoprotein n=1 Tax=Terribacillus aidingensis TaxID=586416 RepID=A0A285NKV0_9BACI|nr:hypothetical protein [Terribacillus aidingensis]SNZ10120.1 hypothetical protein SAMN05421503_1546 [Terribacillus aidingensis]